MKYLAGAVASLAVLLLLIAGVEYSLSAPPRGPLWTVTGSMGTHHMLVVNVDAHPSASLTDIGESIVTPVIGQYDEVLIYVRTGTSTLRRVQWTPQHGYRTLVITR